MWRWLLGVPLPLGRRGGDGGRAFAEELLRGRGHPRTGRRVRPRGPYAALGLALPSLETPSGVLADQVERVLSSPPRGRGADHYLRAQPSPAGHRAPFSSTERACGSRPTSGPCTPALLWHINVKAVEVPLRITCSCTPQRPHHDTHRAVCDGCSDGVRGRRPSLLLWCRRVWTTSRTRRPPWTPDTTTITPYPKALSIEVGSWRAPV